MSSLNKVQLIGVLGRDPEIRSFANGNRVASFSLATTEKWTSKDGERKEKTEWHNIAIFSDGIIKVVERFLRKGARVYIEGKLQTRKWQDQSGNDRYTTEVILQGFNANLIMLHIPHSKDREKPDGGSSDPSNMHGGRTEEIDDDIPF